MLSERLLTNVVKKVTNQYLKMKPTQDIQLPPPEPGKKYMLYMHVPFCEQLCPYCSFNRFPFSEEKARPYFNNMRKEMLMLKDLGYDFESVYIGGGTPTVLLDELCRTIDLARESFSVKEVSTETNPNHLIPSYISQLEGRVDRLSVGVQSFNDKLLKQMGRFEKYGSGKQIIERIQEASPHFLSMNADMIFNFPNQTIDELIRDIECVVESGSSQTTFYPLMASPSVDKSLANSIGKVTYKNEKLFYDVICELLCDDGFYDFGTAWTFNKLQGAGAYNPGNAEGASRNGSQMIDEYVVNYEEYPAIGSGGFTYLGKAMYLNTFSVQEYNDKLDSGKLSIMGKTDFTLQDRMRYRFMMQLFGLRLDKRQFKEDFGVTVEFGLPVEMAFMKACGAFDINDDEQITLTQKGRYLVVVMMRQFFIGVNNLRDQARASLSGDEKELLFSTIDQVGESA